jgi:hypothetical protein
VDWWNFRTRLRGKYSEEKKENEIIERRNYTTNSM